MRRRTFIALLGSAAATWPLAAQAQQLEKTVRIGVLATLPLPPVQRFLRKLQEFGYVEGRNLRLESRFAEGRDDRYPALAAELVALPVDIIVTWGTPAALAAKRATTMTPIVMGAIADPVSLGIVSNLARPEGNITGFASQNVDLEVKRLELLKDLLPRLARVGILGNAANPFLQVALKRLRPAAEQMSVAIELVEIHNSDQIEDALVRLDRARPDAVLVPADNLLLTKRSEIATTLNRSKLPAVYAIREFAAAGGPHRPWRQSRGAVRARDGLRRPHSQRCQARRPASPARNRVRADHQSENCCLAGSQHPHVSHRPRRRGDRMTRREFITLLGGAAAWPLAAAAQSTTQPTQATTAKPPQIEVVRVKPIDPAVPKLGFQLSDGSVDLMKAFSLGGSEGIGGAWKMPPTDETFDARFGQW
jgi:putative tryptophan/tyrosine transport system substrate-binding protein